jgi:hypothetical protein
MPNDGSLFDLFVKWVPDASLREKILVANPALLYGFPQRRRGGANEPANRSTRIRGRAAS